MAEYNPRKGSRCNIGYTHYFYRSHELDATRWNAFVADCRKICAAVEGTKTESAGGYYSGDVVHLVEDDDDESRLKPPVLTAELVRFNGSHISSGRAKEADLGHETFYFERVVDPRDRHTVRDGRVFSFCKTARKPYDVAVTACLIAAKHHFGDDIRISSDGDSVEWMAGCKLCQDAVGYGGDFKINTDREEV